VLHQADSAAYDDAALAAQVATSARLGPTSTGRDSEVGRIGTGETQPMVPWAASSRSLRSRAGAAGRVKGYASGFAALSPSG